MEIISLVYTIPYLLFLLFLILLMFLEFYQLKYNRGITGIRLIVMISFLLFFGLKGFVGRDVFLYYDLFSNLPTINHWNSDFFKLNDYEIGFKILMSVSKTIVSNFFFFSFLSVFIDVMILHFIIKRYSRYYVLAFIIYIVFYGYIFEMDQIRNAKAVMLFLLSLRYVLNNKFLSYCLLNLIGFTFHSSSILFLFIYPFLKKRFSLTFYAVVFIIGIVLFVLQIEYIKPMVMYVASKMGGVFQTKAEIYIASPIYGKDMFGITLGFFERIVSYCLFCFIYYKKLIDRDKENLLFINLYVLFFIFYFYFAEFIVLAVRTSALFIAAYFVLYPNVLFEINRKLTRQLVVIMLTIFMFFRMAAYVKYIEYKYENILFDTSSYKIRKSYADESANYLQELDKK